jgi:cytoskeletal protein RodZ
METASTDAQKASDGTVGTLLCATRMRMGKDLQQIAEILHIRYTYLVAIEDGRYEDLPGQAYAIGFVRAYADHLGLDGDEIVRRYKEDSSGLKTRAVFEFPLPTPDSGVPSGALILIAMIMGMVIYGVWYSFAGSDRSAVNVIQEVPDRLTAMLNPEAAQQAQPVDAGAAPESAGDDDSAPVSPLADAVGDTSDTQADGTQSAENPRADLPVSTDGPPVSTDGPPMPADVVELRAKADVWITLKVEKKADRTQLLKKGEVFRAPEGGGGMTLVTAKPSDLDILVNGKVMPAPDAGVFAKGVPLDPDHLKGPGTP